MGATGDGEGVEAAALKSARITLGPPGDLLPALHGAVLNHY